MSETWLPIPGYPGYEITDTGKVRSFKDLGRPRELKQSDTGNGHLKVGLFINGVNHTKYIHQLVLLTFVGPCPEGMEVCHLDSDPANNHLSNLKYDTHQANMEDAAIHRFIARRRLALYGELSEESPKEQA